MVLKIFITVRTINSKIKILSKISVENRNIDI